ncbi:MAG: hypothetical protein AABX16_03250 [Nanoarchaeota archaeon]
MIQRSNKGNLENFLHSCNTNQADSAEFYFKGFSTHLTETEVPDISVLEKESKEKKHTYEEFDAWMAEYFKNNIWIGISGSWRTINQRVVNDISEIVREVIKKKRGILTGGALGVDYITTEIVLKEGDPKRQLRVVLPVKREAYIEHLTKSYFSDVIDLSQTEHLTDQLMYINNYFPEIIFDQTHFKESEFLKPENKSYRNKSYYFRNGLIAYGCNGLVGFSVNKSQGVFNTMRSIVSMHKPSFSIGYTINPNSPGVIRDYDKLNIPNISQDYPLRREFKKPIHVTQVEGKIVEQKNKK